MLTDEEKSRLQELVWTNEARAGRPKEYYAQSQALERAVPKTCTHAVPGCRVCLIAEERERCAQIADSFATIVDTTAHEIADRIRHE